MWEGWDKKFFSQQHWTRLKVYKSILIATQNTVTTMTNKHNSQYPEVIRNYWPIYWYFFNMQTPLHGRENSTAKLIWKKVWCFFFVLIVFTTHNSAWWEFSPWEGSIFLRSDTFLKVNSIFPKESTYKLQLSFTSFVLFI